MDGSMKITKRVIQILPFGSVPGHDVDELKKILTEIADVSVLYTTGLPRGSLNESRGQYDAEVLLKEAKRMRGRKDVILGVTEVDLFTPKRNFVFGASDPDSATAVMSLHRLKWNVDRQQFLSRMRKVALYEIGRVFGLEKCLGSKCVMQYADSIIDLDFNGDRYCRRCDNILRDKGVLPNIMSGRSSVFDLDL